MYILKAYIYIRRTYKYIYVRRTMYNVRQLVESDSSVYNPDPLYITNSNHIKYIQKYFTKLDYLLDVIFLNVLTQIDLFSKY